MRVYIPSPLRSYTSGESEVEASGGTLGAVLDDLDRQYPGIRFRVVDEQNDIRPHIKFFVGLDLAPRIDARVSDRDDVHIIAALSGG